MGKNYRYYICYICVDDINSRYLEENEYIKVDKEMSFYDYLKNYEEWERASDNEKVIDNENNNDTLSKIGIFYKRLSKCSEISGTKQTVLLAEFKELFADEIKEIEERGDK